MHRSGARPSVTTSAPRIGRRLAPLVAIPLFGFAVWVIRSELSRFHYHDIVRALEALPGDAMAWAGALTAVSFVALTGYDVLALRFVGHSLPYRRTALASFIGYAFSNALGFPLFTGMPLRFRLYSGWGLSSVEIGQLVGFNAATLWLGFFALGGLVFLLEPLRLPALLHLPFATARPLGVLLLLVVAAYLAATAAVRRPLRIRDVELALPSPRLAIAQLAVGAFDWAVASAVLYALLPSTADISWPAFLGVFLLAQIAGLVSHIPGGLGVFEAVTLLLLPIPESQLVASLVAYRAVYYLAPLLAATAALGAYEYRRGRERFERLGALLGRGLSVVVPQALAITTFLAGVILLFSGATPAVGTRLGWLHSVLPLPVIELSHFLGSIAGAALLILAWGLQRRLDGAFYLAVGGLAAGIALSLLKGLDYEEATILVVMLAALLASHREFYRKASLLSEPLSLQWITAIVVALGAAVGLGLFSYKRVEYSQDLWWRFATDADAPRFLRATVGALALTLAFATLRLLRPTRPTATQPSPADLERVAVAAAASPYTYAHLALLGDKGILFGGERAFLMYGVEHKSWVALGDPIGAEEERIELAWRFRQLVDEHDGWTVFYQVRPDSLPLYLDLGLTLLKLGEAARVPLADFALEGGHWKSVRHALRALEKEGCRFALVPAAEVPPLLPELARVSTEWLGSKQTREKGFSLGFFDPAYLSRFPVAVVRRGGAVVGFANVLPGGDREELSVDLMRFAADAPRGTMDLLFVELMQWGKAQGYRWFDLGMAPLAGLEPRPLAPLWSRVGSAVFRLGEHFYNFQGLREYKDKFQPVWEPRYLAGPGGLALPRVLANIATLVGGGLRGLVAR
jgi:phosphatidylglycerol lysyltransferase